MSEATHLPANAGETIYYVGQDRDSEGTKQIYKDWANRYEEVC